MPVQEPFPYSNIQIHPASSWISQLYQLEQCPHPANYTESIPILLPFPLQSCIRSPLFFLFLIDQPNLINLSSNASLPSLLIIFECWRASACHWSIHTLFLFFYRSIRRFRPNQLPFIFWLLPSLKLIWGTLARALSKSRCIYRYHIHHPPSCLHPVFHAPLQEILTNSWGRISISKIEETLPYMVESVLVGLYVR